MAQSLTPHQVWMAVALLFMALGAVALTCLILGAAIGSGYRLFMICSGKAVVWRKPRRSQAGRLAVLLHGEDAADTAELPVTMADGLMAAIDRSGNYPPALYRPGGHIGAGHG